MSLDRSDYKLLAHRNLGQELMQAITYHRYGPPDVLKLEEVEKPTPQDKEVLIKIYTATVTTAECEMRSFTFPAWLWLPLRLMFGIFKPKQKILGQELAGKIEAVGKDVRGFKTGDEVFAPITGSGAHAEYICLPSSGAMAIKPASVPYVEATCITAFSLNALHFTRKAEIHSGEKVLINGAGGSIGTIAVQLAKHFGAEVTAVDSAEKLDMLRSIGADHTIDYGQTDFMRNGETYDVILDVVGKSSFTRSIRSLNENGRYVLANPRLLSMLRGLWTSRISSKKVLFELAAYRSEDLTYLGELVEARKILPVIDKCYPLRQTAEAHAYIDTGRKKGNVVLSVARKD